MKFPKVSVVIPMYNSEKTIARTIDSVFKQTYKNWELIIVNDGSVDTSEAIVREIISKNTQFSIQLIVKENGGVSTARNAGMRAATGDYIALLDADDEWLPHKLEMQIKVLTEDSSIDFLGSARNGEKYTRFLWKKFDYLTPISARILLYRTFFVTPTVIFKKKILEEVGFFDETQRYAEEGNYWIRVSKSHHCVLQNESLVITGGGKPHFGFSGLSSNMKGMEKGELKNMRDGLNLGVIGKFEYLFLVTYSLAKYVRRILIVKLR
ncbi:glycosyltransferase family 2 protein [Deminuibacter soli]|uniref:Glycosyltransferase family 2 protein n=1 Tax=Deminuibacter soli TaxID=2291815 RepID=A0A3E1NFB0_9BACT|nr:glycosyltransferase family A protein [Deminuibacter soli]RFM26663.1 glycosyltransferase family 2 protein [Deminuibacter soli]